MSTVDVLQVFTQARIHESSGIDCGIPLVGYIERCDGEIQEESFYSFESLNEEPILNFVCGGRNMAKGARNDRRHEEEAGVQAQGEGAAA